jgi:hypothetical protein
MRPGGAATLLATAGCKLLGDPPGTDFANVWFAAIGAIRRREPRLGHRRITDDRILSRGASASSAATAFEA